MSNYVVGIDRDDGQTEKQVEIVGQIVGPTGFPHADRHGLRELAFEAPVNQNISVILLVYDAQIPIDLQ